MKKLILIISIIFTSFNLLAQNTYYCVSKEVNQLGFNIAKKNTINEKWESDNFIFERLEDKISFKADWFRTINPDMTNSIPINVYGMNGNNKEFFRGINDNVFFEYQEGKFWMSVLQSEAYSKTIWSFYAECKKN